MPFRAYNDPMNDLKNRVALVTGASRGIGAGIAVALAKVGADVAVNYRQRVDAAKSIRDEITRMGRKAIAVPADVSISSAVKRMVAESEAQLGPIDILVNNAAIAHRRKFEDITEFEWDEMLTVNLKSVFLVTKPLSEGCDNRGGAASSTCLRSQRKRVVLWEHTTLHGLTHSCASSFVKDGITVNAIAPALIETDMVTRNPDASPKLIPMGHFGSVNDVASVAVMLRRMNT
jgi:3-oxoacyl-[acyl-carrier protein] reductase